MSFAGNAVSLPLFRSDLHTESEIWRRDPLLGHEVREFNATAYNEAADRAGPRNLATNQTVHHHGAKDEQHPRHRHWFWNEIKESNVENVSEWHFFSLINQARNTVNTYLKGWKGKGQEMRSSSGVKGDPSLDEFMLVLNIRRVFYWLSGERKFIKFCWRKEILGCEKMQQKWLVILEKVY